MSNYEKVIRVFEKDGKQWEEVVVPCRKCCGINSRFLYFSFGSPSCKKCNNTREETIVRKHLLSSEQKKADKSRKYQKAVRKENKEISKELNRELAREVSISDNKKISDTNRDLMREFNLHYDVKKKLTIKDIINRINLIEQNFSNKSIAEINNIYKSINKSTECIEVINIAVNIDISRGRITKGDAYSILIIATFYGILEEAISKNEYLRELYNYNFLESKLIRLINNELNYNALDGIAEPTRKFFRKYKRDFANINPEFKRILERKINNIFTEVAEYIDENNNLKTCDIHGKNLIVKEVLLKLKNYNGDVKYISSLVSFCKECNTVYLGEKYIRALNNTLNGYKVVKSDNEKIEGYDKRLNDESELRKLGYTLALNRKAREELLINVIIPKLGKRKVQSHIRWLIKVNANRNNREVALVEWNYDLRVINSKVV